MSNRIEYKNDKGYGKEDVEGSDGRLNTSSRTDGRRYYNSRDEKQCYSVPYKFNTAASTEYAVYLKNTSNSKIMVISGIGTNSEVATRFQLDEVSGTASGDVVVPRNLNLESKNDADCVAVEGLSNATGISGLTKVGTAIDYAYCSAEGHQEFRLQDVLRLGQNDAVAIQVEETAGGDVGGVIFFYFE